MSRRRLLVALLALSALMVSCGEERAPDPPRSTAQTSALADREITRFALSGEPDWLAADDHHLYVKQDSGTVTAIDPTTNAIAWEVDVASDLCQGIGAGFGSVWACAPKEGTDADHVVRVDATTHQVAATIDVEKDPSQGHLVTGFGRVWVLTSSPAGSDLVGIDPQTQQADPPIPLGVIASDLAVDDTTIWAASPSAGQLVGVDPAARGVVRRVEGLGRLGGPSVVAAAAATIWISGDKATAGIDRRTGEVIVEVPVGAASGGLVVAGTDVWLHADDLFLARVDGTTGEVRERILDPELPSGGDVTIAFGSLWASASDDATLVRVRL